MESKYIEETYQLLIELIQNKCVNPPGDEMRSIKTIEKFLKNKGVSCKIFESKKNRGNLVAVIPGTDKEAPGLIFGPSHIDVVPVTKPDDWKEDPFGGNIKDGFILLIGQAHRGTSSTGSCRRAFPQQPANTL